MIMLTDNEYQQLKYDPTIKEVNNNIYNNDNKLSNIKMENNNNNNDNNDNINDNDNINNNLSSYEMALLKGAKLLLLSDNVKYITGIIII